jgi:hypothetical protein
MHEAVIFHINNPPRASLFYISIIQTNVPQLG